MTSSPPFDVFLSHSHADAEIVHRLAEYLEDECSLKVWLDQWQLVAGATWQDGMARGLLESGACAVCIGEATPQGWFQQEIQRALNHQVRTPAYRVIPVLLPGAQPVNVDDFLELRTWVDLRAGLADEEALRRLVAGIKGQAPGRGPQPAQASVLPPPQGEENPFFFGGAVPAEKFVGRSSSLQLVKTRLGGRSMQSLSIVGERRAGKSSLLSYVQARAGDLFPEHTLVVYLDLMRGYSQTRAGWMRALRRALAQVLGREPWGEQQDGDLASLSFALEDLAGDQTRLVLCLDEIEHLTKHKAEFDELLEELRGAAQLGRIGLLTASAQPLADLCSAGNLASPFYNIFQQEYLGLLQEAEWQQLLGSRMAVSAQEQADLHALASFHPFYTQMAAWHLWEARYHQGPAAWQTQARLSMLPYLQDLWRHLSPEEQQALREAKAGRSANLLPQQLALLESRGLLQDGRPFSQAFAEQVVG